jgi:hypothetical protein
VRSTACPKTSAAFLIELADAAGGAILHLDGVHWLDGATRRVLQQVASRLTESSLLVLATARDDADSACALESFLVEQAGAVDTQVTLGPLDDDAVADLVATHLGGVRVARELTDQLVRRIGGNPFTVVEYIRAVVDAGLLTPSWGGWRLDLAGLDRLELPGDALDLVLQPIDGLGERSRRLLAAGAACGMRFRADLAARVGDADADEALDVLAEAESRRLIAATEPGGYAFLHDRIREALLAELGDPELRRLHQRIAEAIEGDAGTGPAHVYAVARHYARGESDRTPEKVFTTGLAAGRLALADHAPGEAVAFLDRAAAAAATAGITPDAGFYTSLGVACARTGRFADALQHLDRALAAERDRLRRAAILAEIAWVQSSAWDFGRCWETVCQGMAELGRPIPRNKAVLLLTTLASFVAGLLAGITKVGFGTARGDDRERLRLQAVFYDLGGYASTLSMQIKRRALLAFRTLYVANRLGPCPEYTRALTGFGLIANVLGKHKLGKRIFDRSAATATELGDPALVAYVEWKRGAACAIGEVDDGETWQRALTQHERWLDLGDYLTGVASICMRHALRGRTREAHSCSPLPPRTAARARPGRRWPPPSARCSTRPRIPR